MGPALIPLVAVGAGAVIASSRHHHHHRHQSSPPSPAKTFIGKGESFRSYRRLFPPSPAKTIIGKGESIRNRQLLPPSPAKTFIRKEESIKKYHQLSPPSPAKTIIRKEESTKKYHQLSPPSPAKTFIGKRRLFHATSRSNGESIKKSGIMHCGSSGMFGAGIYFANSPDSAKSKAQNDRRIGDAMVLADVDLGTSLEVWGANRNLNNAIVSSKNCQSVHGHIAGRDDEFVVFDSWRVTIIRVY
jgi:hypothetical protein